MGVLDGVVEGVRRFLGAFCESFRGIVLNEEQEEMDEISHGRRKLCVVETLPSKVPDVIINSTHLG
jgi:hypothetical protein